MGLNEASFCDCVHMNSLRSFIDGPPQAKWLNPFIKWLNPVTKLNEEEESGAELSTVQAHVVAGPRGGKRKR